ncbi:ABC transporter substrate-binding protein [Cohnella sp. WQ 127256]|uniref:ABC transporter substrate-binding protein n=1 Tax=Cohnella sp. WQ 127256 TaxID=2938790 RepID=UPI002117A30E|nr:extracellular solute-binding protein [Cohnella sp. WQ 127256]
MKKTTILILITMITLLLAVGGCRATKNEGGEWAPLNKDEEVTIKVLYWSDQQFQADYGSLFATEFPNINVEVISNQGIYNDPSIPREQAFDQFIEQNQPDVLFFLDSNYDRYVREGKLRELDTVIKQDSFELDGYHPAVLSMLRNEGDGKLYGLSHQFSSEALFYNIDLFKKYNVELPRDAMSWDEVFELAKQFPTDGDKESRIYGLSIDGFMPPAYHYLKIGSVQDLSVLNADETEVQINSDSWRKVFESLISAIKSGAYYHPTLEEQTKSMRTLKDNHFITGKSAMTIKSEAEISDILNAKTQLNDITPVNWGVVTAPVDPNNRTQSNSYSLGAKFAISMKSSQPRAAWEFIKYLNSDKHAQLKSKTNRDPLFSRTEFIRAQDGRNIDAFYKLEPKGKPNTDSNEYWMMMDVVGKELDAVIEDKKTLDEAIQDMQKKGQEELLKMKAEKK